MTEEYTPKHSTGEYVVTEEVTNFLDAVNEDWKPLVGRHRIVWTNNSTLFQKIEWNAYKRNNKERFNV